jgi:hypothetical protein
VPQHLRRLALRLALGLNSQVSKNEAVTRMKMYVRGNIGCAASPIKASFPLKKLRGGSLVARLQSFTSSPRLQNARNPGL